MIHGIKQSNDWIKTRLKIICYYIKDLVENPVEILEKMTNFNQATKYYFFYMSNNKIY